MGLVARNGAVIPSTLLVLLFTGYAARSAVNEEALEKLGYANVRERFGVKGDGRTDDTAALGEALRAPSHGYHRRYLPPGTYLVSDTIRVGRATWRRTWVQGAGREEVTVRLKDDCPGFRDPKRPKAVLLTYPLYEGGNTAVAFDNRISDLTIEVGKGNPGAIGLHYHCSNWGSVRNVTIRSRDPGRSGLAGLAFMRNWPGPCMVRGLRVEGFDHGIRAQSFQYSITFSDVELSNQLEHGVYNTGQKLVMENVRSVNRVPAIRTEGAPSSSSAPSSQAAARTRPSSARATCSPAT
jgi:hypothetical protein